jgi:hypothetical protein
MTRENILMTLKLLMTAFCLMLLQGTMAQFSIGPGGWVTVKSGSSLYIGTDLHIKSVAGASGYLVDQNVNGDIDITGNATIERYLTPDVWHNVSSPVSNENTSVYSGTDLIFWYNEALVLNDWNFGWVWYQGPTGGPLMVFRGYDVLFYTNPVTIDYLATGVESVNTGPYSISVINTSSTPSEIPSHKGWNLLGNPYPSPVDWLAGSGWDKSDINDAKYIWDGANNVYTIFLGGGSPVGINGGTRFIPSNQGFWVQSVVASGTVSINNATRVGDISGTPDYYKLDPIDYPLVSIVSFSEEYQDEVVVRFLQGTTEGFDISWDATKLLSINEDVPQLIIRHGERSFALNTLPEIKPGLEVGMSFRCAKEGEYKIRLDDRTNLDPTVKVYLRDVLEENIVQLEKGFPYTFHHEPNTGADRFKLFFDPDQDIINDISAENWFTVYGGRQQINIIKNTVKDVSGKILVYNMLGQILLIRPLNNDDMNIIQLSLPEGYYIVSIVTSQLADNTKVFVW